MGITVKMTNDNTDAVKQAVEQATAKALETIGLKMETYAKALCPVGKSPYTSPWTGKTYVKKGYRGGTLRNSIAHRVDDDFGVMVGTNVEYAPYVELGTGPHFVAPPDWEQFTSTPGAGVGGAYVHPRPYLRPAIEDHIEEYKNIYEQELKKVVV